MACSKCFRGHLEVFYGVVGHLEGVVTDQVCFIFLVCPLEQNIHQQRNYGRACFHSVSHVLSKFLLFLCSIRCYEHMYIVVHLCTYIHIYNRIRGDLI